MYSTQYTSFPRVASAAIPVAAAAAEYSIKISVTTYALSTADLGEKVTKLQT
jgi:hypothetical protein